MNTRGNSPSTELTMVRRDLGALVSRRLLEDLDEPAERAYQLLCARERVLITTHGDAATPRVAQVPADS